MAGSITLLSGPARSGKSSHLVDWYRRALHDAPLGTGCSCILIVPNHLAVVESRNALLSGGGQAFLAPGIDTFAGFARRIVSWAGSPVQPLSVVQRRGLLRQAVEGALAEGRLTFFRQAARRQGFLAQVEASIAEWKRRDLWAETLRRRHDKKTPARERELVEIYGRYERLLVDARLYDEEGLFWAARDALRETPRLLKGIRVVAVDGFSDFTAAQIDILSLLLSRTSELAITLPDEWPDVRPTMRRSDLFAKCDATRSRLEQLATVEQRSLEPCGDPWPALSHLERNLFRAARTAESLPEAALASVEQFHVIEASSEQAEVEEVAARIKALLLAGEDAHDIVAALRTTGDYADRLRSVFADFGVPVALDAPVRLSSAPWVRSVLSVLRLEADDWPYRGLLAVIGDRTWTYFDRPLEGSTGVRAAMERQVRLAQVPAGREALLRKLRAASERAAATAVRHGDSADIIDRDSMGIDAAFRELQRLADLLKAFRTPAPVSVWLARIVELSGALEALPEGAGKKTGARPIARGAVQVDADRQAWAKWREALLGVAQLDLWTRPNEGPTELELRRFVELAAEAASMVRIAANGSLEGCVRILSAEAARHTRPRHLFLLGLAEQSFPSSIRPSDLATERFEEGGGAAAIGAPIAGDRGGDRVVDRSVERQRDEMLLFYQLVTRPSASLTLSYPALDSKAQPLPPSPYLTEVERCLSGAAIPRTQLGLGRRDGACDEASEEKAYGSLSRFRRGSVAAALQGECKKLALLACSDATAGGVPGALDGLEAIAWRSQWSGFSAHEGLLSTPAARRALTRRFGPQHLWSPSQLETFAECPFKFFGEQLLGLEPPPELRLASDHRRRGSLMHEALAQLHQSSSLGEDDPFGDDATPLLTPESQREFIERFRQRVNAVYGKATEGGVDGALREIERLQILSWAEALANQHLAYAQLWPKLDVLPTPTHLELRFGPSHRDAAHQAEASRSTDTPYLLDLGQEKIQLTGRIDRVDVGRVGETTVFNVIDYKTSKVQVKLEQIVAGKQLQLALYSLATEELLLAADGARALAAGFWAVQGDGFNTEGGKNSRKPVLEIRSVSEGRVRVNSEWATLKQQIADRVRTMVDEIRNGRFPVYNEDEECGRFCHLRTICGIHQVRSLRKTWEPQ